MRGGEDGDLREEDFQRQKLEEESHTLFMCAVIRVSFLLVLLIFFFFFCHLSNILLSWVTTPPFPQPSQYGTDLPYSNVDPTDSLHFGALFSPVFYDITRSCLLHPFVFHS